MSPTSALFSHRGALAAVLLLLPCAAAVGAEDNTIRVSVVAVLATDQDDKIDPKLPCVAREVRKLDPKLTGFHIAVMTTKELAVGGADDFDLGNDQTLHVVVAQKNDKDGRFQMKITPPRMGDITYTTAACGRFFPVMTPFRTKDNELLIVGVCVQPCAGK